MKAAIKVNFQAKPTSDTLVLIMAYVNFSFKVKEEVNTFNGKRVTEEQSNQLVSKATIHDRAYHWTETKYKPIYISTGISMPASFWDNESKLAIDKTVNEKLMEFKSAVEQLYEQLTASGIQLTPESFKQQIKQHILKTKADGKNFHLQLQENNGKVTRDTNEPPTTIADYIDFKIKEWTQSGRKTKGTCKAFSTLRKWIAGFEAAKMEGEKLDILTLDDNRARNFFTWILTQKKEDGTPYKLNFISGLKTRLKVLLHEAENEDDYKLSQNLNLKKKIYAKKTETVDDIYLSVEQLDKIRKLKFRKSEEHLDVARDMFIIGSYCGFRYSDLRELHKLAVEQGEYYFNLQKSEKTKISSKIPVVEQFIIDMYKKKYKERFNFTMHDVNFNENIKKVIERAGFTQEVEMTNINPVTLKNYKTKYPFYDMVSSKTMRKSFASNMVRHYNMPLPVVMSWSGHKTESAFRSYIRLTTDEYYAMANRQLKGIRRTQAA